MLDANTKKACKDDPSIREIKIRNIEHAIEPVSYTHLRAHET